jgi:hypothetical protein
MREREKKIKLLENRKKQQQENKREKKTTQLKKHMLLEQNCHFIYCFSLFLALNLNK